MTPDTDEHPAKTWMEFVEKLQTIEKDGAAQWNYKRGHAGLGVSVVTGYGDGVYNVYVRRNDKGRVIEARVVFIEDEKATTIEE